MYRDLPPGRDASTTSCGAPRHFAKVGVSTLVTGAVGDDPAGWLESTFGPAMEGLAAIETAPLWRPSGCFAEKRTRYSSGP